MAKFAHLTNSQVQFILSHILKLEENIAMNCKERKSYLLPCPVCHEKTDVKIHEDTTLLYFPLQCPHCKQETLIHVVQLKMVEVKNIEKTT